MFLTVEVFLLKHSVNSSLEQSFKHCLKLGKRLQQIEKMVTVQQYGHIWDCCCDHGLLGCALLNRLTETTISTNIVSNIHFVDIVPELMTELENKLQNFYSNSAISTRWKTHCQDVANLPLEQYEGKHLIIIAGVGGDLMIKLIEAIYQKHKNLNVDFLLCPVHHQFSLRSKLIELDFSLKDEVLVEDKQRFYEILLVSSASVADNKEASKVSPVGDKIWQSNSTIHSNENSLKQSLTHAEIADIYLNKTLNHYQRMQKGLQQSTEQDNQQVKAKNLNSDVQQIINAYRAVILPSLVS